MSNKVASKYKLFIFIPLLLGILVDNVSLISKLYADLFWLVSILFIAFWFWAGKVFARISESETKGFVIGNSVWLMSFISLKLWRDLPEARNIITNFLEDFAQYYVIGIAPIIIKVLNPYYTVTTGAMMLAVAYTFMFITFLLGFIYELFSKRKKVRSIGIIALLSIINLPVIILALSWRTHGVGDSGTFVKGSYQEIKSSYSNYTRNGFSVYPDFDIKSGRIEYQITNPKGEIILKGYAVKENGETYNKITYYKNHRQEYCMIEPFNLPGKYTLRIKPNGAIGDYDIWWHDTATPLI